MSLESTRVSVFTFQSSVHSAHVLRSLDEQRRRDVLCDVTLLVEGTSYRAHCAVLAACSDYFQSRVAGHGGQGLVLTLPDEVTAKGFEPLLQFAYSAKLLFTKENILEIHNCATVLGFHNLDKACFEFLVPKFFDNSRHRQGPQKKLCCKVRCCKDLSIFNDGDETGPNVVPQDSLANKIRGDLQCQATENIEELIETNRRGVEEARFQTDNTLTASPVQDRLSLDNCGPQMPPLPQTFGGDLSSSPCLPCLRNSPEVLAGNVCCGSKSEISHVCPRQVDMVASCLPFVPPICGSPTSTPLEESLVIACGDSSASGGSRCPVANFDCLVATVGMEGNKLLDQNVGESTIEFTPDDSALSGMVPENSTEGRSSVEREVAEHLAKGFWPDLCPSQTDPLLLNTSASSTLDKANDFHWLKQLDLSSSTGDCPFLRDLGAEEVPVPTSEGASQVEKSPYVSSINSGEDSDLDTEGDSESNHNEMVCEVPLPFPVKIISTLSRNEFQQLLRQHTLTREQLDFVHDVRRRSKNRVAAQRCRKRKLDCIYNLECEIDKLKSEKEKLLLERNQLRLSMEETLHSLSGLCQKVSEEAILPPDHQQVLAKFSTPESLLSALPFTDGSPPRPALPSQDHGAGTLPPDSTHPELVPERRESVPGCAEGSGVGAADKEAFPNLPFPPFK